jgi:hypothetical protein
VVLDFVESLSEPTILTDLSDLEIPDFLVRETSSVSQGFLDIKEAELEVALGTLGLSCHLDWAPSKV